MSLFKSFLITIILNRQKHSVVVSIRWRVSLIEVVIKYLFGVITNQLKTESMGGVTEWLWFQGRLTSQGCVTCYLELDFDLLWIWSATIYWFLWLISCSIPLVIFYSFYAGSDVPFCTKLFYLMFLFPLLHDTLYSLFAQIWHPLFGFIFTLM